MNSDRQSSALLIAFALMLAAVAFFARPATGRYQHIAVPDTGGMAFYRLDTSTGQIVAYVVREGEVTSKVLAVGD